MPRNRVDLIVWDNGRALARMLLNDGVYLVGRDPACAIKLVSDRVSREHARVVVQGPSVAIEDLGSRNGIYFDGKRTPRHAIDDGNYLFVDPFVLEFQVKRVEPVVWSPRPHVTMHRGPVIARIIRLTDASPGGRDGTIDLDRDVVTIGRDPDSRVRLDDHAASRNHAEIHRLGDVWVIRDLQSANGTYVNGEPIRESSLKDGDEVRIGATLFRLDLQPVLLHAVRERRAS
jgi:ABC transport system ATP-binding/permease protein